MKRWLVLFFLCMTCLITGCARINPSTQITFHEDLTGTWDTVIASDEKIAKQTMVNLLSAVPVQGYRLWLINEKGERVEAKTAGQLSHYWEVQVNFRSEEEFNRIIRAVHRVYGRPPTAPALHCDGNSYLLDMGASIGRTVIRPEGQWEKTSTSAGIVQGNTITYKDGDLVSLRLYKSHSFWWYIIASFGVLFLCAGGYVLFYRHKKEFHTKKTL